MKSIFLTALAISVAFVPLEHAEAKGKSIYSVTKVGQPNPKTRYGTTRVSSPVRAGKRAQKFELRHGDCGRDPNGWSDCEHDRQRIERSEFPGDRIQKVGKRTWYGWSMYLPSNFRDIGPSNTLLGQVKLTDWPNPIWFLNLREGRLRVMFAEPAVQIRECTAVKLSEMRGRWTDIVIYADYSYNPKGESFAIYINGKKTCSKSAALLTPQMVQNSRGSLYLKYGIYNSYVSNWLNRHKTKSVTPKAFNDKQKSGLVLKSSTSTPFSYDWGVTIPTQVVIYDEMRFGSSRDEVDIRTLEKSNVRPVD